MPPPEQLLRAFLVALLALWTGHAPASSTIVRPESHQPAVAGLVGAALSNYHYNETPIDDALSECWFQGYLDDLDPDHSLLLAADLQEFEKWRRGLDDTMTGMAPDLTPAWTIQARVRTAQMMRNEYFSAHMDDPISFDKPERFEIDRSEAAWPESAAERDERWRLQLKAWRLDLTLDEEQTDSIHDRIQKRLVRLQQAMDETESADILERYLDAMASCFDPHTVYFRPASAEDFAISTTGSLEGIGAALQRDGDFVKVTEIIKGGPADRSEALFADDRIVGVAQGPADFVDVIGMRLEKVVHLIRGAKGTQVRLKILPAGTPSGTTVEKELALERDRIDLETVEPKGEMKEVTGADGVNRKVLVINVPAFAADPGRAGGGRPPTTDQVAAILKANPGAQAVVLDLRENSGGFLSEAIRLAGLFIDKGPVVQVRSARGKVEILEDEDAGRAWSGPLVVLTSPLTASASEIVTGALQDYGRALVVGSTTTYGKGTVQTVVPLDPILSGMLSIPEGNLAGSLKVTISQYYAVDGKSPQADGVPSDVILPSPYEGRIEREGENPHALPADSIRAAKYKVEGNLSSTIPTLKSRSAARVKADPELKAVQEYMAWMDRVEHRDWTSLELETRKKEAAEADTHFKAMKEAVGEDADPVLEEALRVTADLVELKG